MLSRIAFAANIFLLIYFSVYNLNPDTIFFQNDQASALAVAASVNSGEFVLSGPPASLGGRHWGPYYYYFEALNFLLAAGDAVQAIRFNAIFKALAILLLLYVGSSLIEQGKRSYFFIATFFALAAGHWYWVLRVPWHSHYLLLPTVFLLTCSLKILRNGLTGIPPFLLALNLLILSHLSPLPLGAAFFLGIAVFLGLNHPAETKLYTLSRQFFGALFLASLLWLPVIIYDFSYDDNLTTVFTKDHPDSKQAGFVEALTRVAEVFKRYSVGEANGLLSNFFSPTTTLVAFIFSFLLLWLYILKKHEDKTFFYISLISILSVLLYTISLSRLPSPLSLHLLFGTAPFILLLFSCISTHAIELVLNFSRPTFLASCLASLYLLLVLNFGLPSAFENLKIPDISELESLKNAQTVAEIITNDAKHLPFVLRISGNFKRRESAIYYFAGNKYFQFMPEAKKLPELSSFNASVEIEKNSIPRYYLRCSADGLAMPERWQKNAKKSFKFSKDISLDGCSSCSLCRLQRWEAK